MIEKTPQRDKDASLWAQSALLQLQSGDHDSGSSTKAYTAACMRRSH